MHFVQIRNRERRTVAVTEGSTLHLLEPFVSVYELALNAIRREKPWLNWHSKPPPAKH